MLQHEHSDFLCHFVDNHQQHLSPFFIFQTYATPLIKSRKSQQQLKPFDLTKDPGFVFLNQTIIVECSYHMLDLGPTELNQDLLYELSVFDVLKTEYSFYLHGAVFWQRSK
jgi:hypothetical protein